MTEGSSVEDTAQVDGQQTPSHDHRRGGHKTNKLLLEGHSPKSTEMTCSTNFQSIGHLALNTVLLNPALSGFKSVAPEAGRKTDTKQTTNWSFHAVSLEHEFSDGFLWQLGERILAFQHECARIRCGLAQVRDEETVKRQLALQTNTR